MNIHDPSIKVFGPRPWGPAVHSECEYVGPADPTETCFACGEQFLPDDSGIYMLHQELTSVHWEPWHRECELANVLPHEHPHPERWQHISRHQRAKEIVAAYNLATNG